MDFKKSKETMESIVWSKTYPNSSDSSFKRDFAGAWIRKEDYGKTTEYGWEIDHIYPKALGGEEKLDNLQAIHWRNNRSKGDDYPHFCTTVSSEGFENKMKTAYWTYKKDAS